MTRLVLFVTAGAGAVVGSVLNVGIDRLSGSALRSIRRPVVPVLTAAMFAAGWWYYGPTLPLLSRLLLGCALILLFVIDVGYHVLPNVVTLPGIVVGFVLSFVTEPGWRASLGGVAVGGGFLWLVAEISYRVRGAEGLGMGDVKMLAMIGAFLGWKLVPVALMTALIVGSAVSLGLIAARRAGLKSAMPFGAFLAIGAAVAATVGAHLLDRYGL